MKKTITNANIPSKKKNKKPLKSFESVYSNVAGIDIGAKSIFIAIPLSDREECEVHEMGTTTPDLIEIAKLLKASNITSAAMEATGVYWIPLFETLEDQGIKPILIDAKSAKNVPGRKSDVMDCQWIQKLYSCGLLRPAFRPEKDKEAFRSYMRHRSNLAKGRQIALSRINKILILMNIKLDIAVSDIAGVSGMAIIRAIVEGERDPAKLASLRNKFCKKSEAEFIKALTGNFQEPHLFALKQNLEIYDFHATQMQQCDAMISTELKKWETLTEKSLPSREKDKRKHHAKYSTARKPEKNEFHFDMRALLHSKTGLDLTAIPSLGELTVATIISELGGAAGIKSFKTEKHWCSWLSVCPGNNISGGKSFGGHNKKSRNRIKRSLCTASMSLSKSNCAFGAFYRRMAARIGKAKAIKALAHKLAKLIYRLLTLGSEYVEVGQEKYEMWNKERKIKSLRRQARELGFDMQPAA